MTISVSFLFPQDHIDELIQHVLHGSKDSAAISFPKIEHKYPNNPSVMYLKGLLETDGEKAMTLFTKLYNTHPASDYGDDAVMKVSEYYYAAGLYVQAADWLKKIPQYYSKSEHLEKSIKLFINALTVSGNTDSAVYYSKVFKKQFPDINLEEYMLEVKQDYESERDTAPVELSKKNISGTTEIQNDSKKKNKNIIVKIQDLLDKVKNDITTPINEYSLQAGAFGKKIMHSIREKYY